MADIAELGIKVLSGDVVKATKRLDKLERQSKQNVKENKKLSTSFKGVGAAVGALGLGLAFKTIISLATEQERVVKQLDAAIKSTGGSAGFTTKELQKMAAGFQEVTTFGDEAIISAQSILLTFTNLKDDVFPATTEAVLNLSARMGTDLKSSAIQLGKALNDPIANLSALSRSGIQFSEDQKATIKALVETNRLADAQKIILKELEVQFGGSAKAARDTFGGAIKSLGNAFGDLLEGDGGNLNDAKGSIEELVKILQSEGTKAAFGAIVTAVVELTSALVGGVVALNDFGKSLGIFLAGDDVKSLEELNSEIERTGNAIEKTKQRLEIAEGGGLLSFLNGDPDEIREQIRNLTVDLDLLNMAKSRLEGGEGATDEAVSGDKEEEISGVDLSGLVTDKQLKEREEAAKHKEELLTIENDYFSRLYNLQAGSLEAGSAFAKSLRDNDAKGALKTGALMLSNVAKQNKEGFELQKAFALANAIVTLPSAVMKSFDNGGGYPWGLIPAGLMLAQGAAQISAISSTSFGSKTSASSVGGGGTSPSAPVASGLPAGSTALPDSGEQVAKKEIRVIVEGDSANSEAMRSFIKNLEETAADMGSDTKLVLSA